jgi:molybdate transport system substrate-binding protein
LNKKYHGENGMRWRALVVVLAMVLTSGEIQAKPVYLSVAASMTDAFKEIISEFSIEHPQIEIFPNFASSGSLAKQIEQGAPADVYVSANPKWMAYLKKSKMVAEQTVVTFAHNRLVFVGAENLKVTDLKDILSLEQIAIGTPASVPAGQYAKQALEAVGVYQGLKQAKKFVLAKDVRQALLYADRGEVEGAFVYKTDALLARNCKILITVPRSLHEKISYPLGMTISGLNSKDAKVFFAFIRGEKTQTILRKYGFEPAEITN